MPKPIRRSDGKILKAEPYSFPDPFAKPDIQEIAEAFERILRGEIDPCDGYLYHDDDDDSCIEMD